MGSGEKLRFVHLSDIHFSNRVATFGFDPDRELRRWVQRDIAERVQELGPATAILVSGDIAYAGKREEFEDAAAWLEEVCGAAGCCKEAVLMCPGNHDVDRAVIERNQLIQDGHEAIRRGPAFYDRDSALTRRLTQTEARSLFYSPIAEYNSFAARYQSSFFADQHTFVWEQDFTLNDGSILRIRGLNTALLSGLADVEGSLFLGTRAWTLPRHDGVEYLVMAHHPPKWLADQVESERAFEGSARIHVFGHEHNQRVQPGRDWIKLYAGSVNPHRAEPNWTPGYNILEVSVEDSVTRRLKVEVHAREWQGNPPQFRNVEDVGHRPVFAVDIALPPLPPTFCRKEASEPKEAGIPPAETTAITGTGAMDPQRRFRAIVYRFFRLSLSKKEEIVGHLRLAEETDSRLTDVERFKLALIRARERGQVDELADMVEQQEKK
ncbi:metallophosphoesterase [Cupriavidus basilensis]|uniref:metallophosphoesterase n=1 Tax=Cupriavidus basilensis TaxID=68895 RepID=UPI0020A64D83|nr:metallophosphoesterase [Cupriavidus basilensis]MCP3024543.1 metallophosphoesterase [Cupriavidus basilensis]